ncbi:MAG: nucleoside deaminase [Clostridiales bacterium]|nr:nucleoside deaminase [Clostridiales bacterium]
MEDKIKFMRAALKEAKKGFDRDECPIGCVIVKDGKVLSRAHNMKLSKNNPILHAEVVAIDKACRKTGDWRLNDCDMYVTLEPCTMCSGAIVQARIRKVYFGAYEPKSGAVCSCNDIFNVEHGHNHAVDFEGGILEDECAELMKAFFKKLRTKAQTARSVQDKDTSL